MLFNNRLDLEASLASGEENGDDSRGEKLVCCSAVGVHGYLNVALFCSDWQPKLTSCFQLPVLPQGLQFRGVTPSRYAEAHAQHRQIFVFDPAQLFPHICLRAGGVGGGSVNQAEELWACCE